MVSQALNTRWMYPSSPAKLLAHGQGLFRHQDISVESRLRYARRRHGLHRLYRLFRQILADCGLQKKLEVA